MLSSIEIKVETFKKDYAKKIGFSQPEDVKLDSTKKTQLYYFNVDLKFVLKARLHVLKTTFEEKVVKTSAAEGTKFECLECEFGRVQSEKEPYTEVDANGMGFKCSQCKSDLTVKKGSATLNDDEQKTARILLEKCFKDLSQFNEYIIPKKFFGPGHLSAYVGHGSEFTIEDPSTIDWQIEQTKEDIGSLTRQRKTNSDTLRQLVINGQITPELEKAVDFYSNSERKRMRLN